MKDFADKISAYIDVGYSHDFAVALERFGSHPTLGFKTAGSRAELEAGDFILNEMRRIGLEAFKDGITVDGWEFSAASLQYSDGGREVTVELGAYATDMQCENKTFTLINAGRCTSEELDQLDLKGKIALVFVNQRDEWWINYPAYAAHLRGAAAVIAVQNSGFGEVNAGSLNAQDICGPEYAPALSMSKTDARALVETGLSFGCETQVRLTVKSKITKNVETFNIIGTIRGESDSMLMLSAHYDAYFKGFQDDNTGVAMLLSIARAVVKSGVKPKKTLVFCAFAAEEWGLCDSRYDWSAGAFREFAERRPDWPQKTVADINIELPAFSHGVRHYMRCVYEYKIFLRNLKKELPGEVTSLYPRGVDIVCPVQTWSDDFAVSLAGIPSMVNEFKAGSFMETHYHSQYDTDSSYDEAIYRFHHMLYARVMCALDETELPPMNFASRFNAMDDALEPLDDPYADGGFRRALYLAAEAGRRLYCLIEDVNSGTVSLPCERRREAEKLLLAAFRFCQDRFVSLDWYEKAVFPFENAQSNVLLLTKAASRLAAGNIKGALEMLYEVDDNSYCDAFDREVVEYFADTDERRPSAWGKGRRDARIDLYDIIRALKRGETAGIADSLTGLRDREYERLTRTVRNLTPQVSEAAELFDKIADLISLTE